MWSRRRRCSTWRPRCRACGKVSLPLSGFRLRSQINAKKIWDEFLVFQGASYFRAVAQHLLYGLSARGLAINTAEPCRRGIPGIHAFLDRAARARKPTSIVIYALLESDSTTGAYRFTRAARRRDRPWTWT